MCSLVSQLNNGQVENSPCDQTENTDTMKEDSDESQTTEEERIFFQEIESAQQMLESNLFFTADGSPSLVLTMYTDAPRCLVLQVRTASRVPITVLSTHTNPKISEIKLVSFCPSTLQPSGSLSWDVYAHSKEEGKIVFPILIKTENHGNLQNHAVELVFHFRGELHPFPEPSDADYSTFVGNINYRPISNFGGEELRMCQYTIPSDVYAFLNHNLKPFAGITKQQKMRLDYIKHLINPDCKRRSLWVKNNYTPLLEILLYAEEQQMNKNMKIYDQTSATLEKQGDLLELQVPDLSEGRPSVLITDVIRLRDSDGVVYHGVVRQVNQASVLLKFFKRSPSVNSIENRRFHVSFCINRHCLRAQHQAVHFTANDKIEDFFFETIIPPLSLDEELVWFNESIADNLEQQQAVRAILRKSAMPAPYIIFGPPGTGKTMTVAEAVKQIYTRTKENVLICTPSNNAANEMTRRLVDIVPQGDLLRIVASSFSDLMPKELTMYSNFKNGECYQPKMKEVLKYRIVITTLISAARLINKRCPVGHFSFVFVDEAGQATESETLIPVAHLLSDGVTPGQLVLAGDPRQLGPIIQSNFAKECGFDVSMLERLIDTCSQYQKDESGKRNPAAISKLLKNYRSHPVLLHQPNLMFYEGELQVAGDDSINIAVNWEHLPNKEFPLIFYGVVGVDQREENSPSYFNLQEIAIVMDYLDKLIGSDMNGTVINEDHIAIISPYKMQVEKIKQAIMQKGYEKIPVCSVEQIQGQERTVVIISTVRSQPQLINHDLRFNLGFFTNPKRFNVAITRAKALLIVVGNPRVLQLDCCWKSFIQYCKDNGALIGEKIDLSEGESGILATADEFFTDDIDSGLGTSLLDTET